MDIQQPIKEQSVHHETKEILDQSFLLPGQQLTVNLANLQYNYSKYVPANDGLVSLYAGFPNDNNRKNVTSLVHFPLQYIPEINDLVIGVVKIRTSETFVIDIGAPLDAILGGLQFDGATKRNKPNLKVGSLVYCRVISYSKYIGGKLSCINKGTSSKKTNQLGQLKEGVVFWLPQFKHQQIQKNILEKLGKCVKFEVAFGKNGRIWINSAKSENIILILNILKLVGNNAEEEKINSLIALIK